jgi:hypothetical protein
MPFRMRSGRVARKIPSIARRVGSQAFVHSKSGTTTEIGQADLERRESNPDELSALPLPQHPEKNILTTTTMSVRYSER